IGGGAIGGKAQGLVSVARDVLAATAEGDFPEFVVRVPDFAVLGTDVFREFVADNDLARLERAGLPDDRIAHAFQRGEMPPLVLGELRALVEQPRGPLAVRSSSLLEDALAHPFAGVYATKMTPNNQASADERFRRLLEAVKFVWASTYFAAAVSYRDSIDTGGREEAMAVIVQEVVGSERNRRFYPTLSGVARTYNYYPTGAATPHDGVASLALGLGRQIVDGGACWTYVPAYPAAGPPYADVGERLDAAQRTFWAVDTGEPPLPDPLAETEYLAELSLDDADYDGQLEHLVSTYDHRSDRLRPGRQSGGAWCLDFSPLLSLGTLPLNGLVQRLLSQAEQAVDGAVEIEFAVDVPLEPGRPARFGFLQMRPMAVDEARVDLPEAALTGPDVVVRGRHALGNGERHDLCDVVYLDPERFDAGRTPAIARELGERNRELLAAGRPYLLLGFGRWGSSDPWLGVPVAWGQISGARVLVESSLPSMNPDISQGSHFFHNLIGLKILYLATARGDETAVDWDWLARQPLAAAGEYTRHVRLERPLHVVVDGINGRGAVRHD
ncbi:hypothetical protein KDK88_08905, partial [bacterium]|nr:hypothetical protein [bacterium]